ncbi:MAG: universal stress protein [Usitatibacter sp.]
MIVKILLGFDGSESSRAAFRFALDLAKRYSAELHVLAVARPPDFGEDVETRALIEQSQRHLEGVLSGLKSQVRDVLVRGHFEVAVGHPAEQLVRYAEAHGIDHVVVGHRGHSLFERWLIGSVARQVIAYANCAVTVVRADRIATEEPANRS